MHTYLHIPIHTHVASKRACVRARKTRARASAHTCCVHTHTHTHTHPKLLTSFTSLNDLVYMIVGTIPLVFQHVPPQPISRLCVYVCECVKHSIV
jgi:hypothetical protein